MSHYYDDDALEIPPVPGISPRHWAELLRSYRGDRALAKQAAEAEVGEAAMGGAEIDYWRRMYE